MSFFNVRALSSPPLRCCLPRFLVLIACEAHRLRASEAARLRARELDEDVGRVYARGSDQDSPASGSLL